MNGQKPSYFIEVWKDLNDRVLFQELTGGSYSEYQERFERKVIVNGKSACVYVFVDDKEISSYQCACAATTLMRGGGLTTEVNLDRCTSRTFVSDGKLNPRQ